MARRVLQFPVRNAFAPRAQDALARDTQDHAHRIVQQVENELSRKAERLSTDNSEEMERARSYGVVMMPQPVRAGIVRKCIAALRSNFSGFASNLFRRPKTR